ncbi:cyclic nucleotide-gated channel beta-1-like [Macrobrachium rosenbergii]|uniref:cyclic nucleotide-gated channel beta-1-like n=1 Tax=Macrobrachium rosenbergii TaxID=79674 RepID=UPI0034D42A44
MAAAMVTNKRTRVQELHDGKSSQKARQENENGDVQAEFRRLDSEEFWSRMKVLESEENLLRLQIQADKEKEERDKAKEERDKEREERDRARRREEDEREKRREEEEREKMTPEYYNERFRSLKKDDKITFLEYALTDKPLRISPSTELEKKKPHLSPSCVTTTSMKRVEHRSEETEDLPVPEGSLSLEELFQEGEISPNVSTEEILAEEENPIVGKETPGSQNVPEDSSEITEAKLTDIESSTLEIASFGEIETVKRRMENIGIFLKNQSQELSNKPINTGHGGEKKTYKEVCEQYGNIPRSIVSLYIVHCERCVEKRRRKETAAGVVVRPLSVRDLNERGQVDLVDMQTMKDGSYRFILHYMEYLTKFHVIRP